MTREPKNPRYSVYKHDDGSTHVIDKKTGKDRRYFPTCFVYGQMGYDPETSKYPDYVHGLFWDLND